MKRASRYLLIISIIFLIVGALPYKPAWFINHEDYLLVSPQACGCPCPDMSIKNGEVLIPEHLKSICDSIQTHECYIKNDNVISRLSSGGMYYDYYIKGNVVGIDSLMCGEFDCEYAPVIDVEKTYLAEYVAVVWFSKSPTLLLIYLGNMIIILPALIITVLVNYYIKRKKNK